MASTSIRAQLGGWLRLGIDVVYDAAAPFGSGPAHDSLAWQDEHTIEASHEGTSGPGIARLTLLGAAELIRTLGDMYVARHTSITRGHLPLARSIQEHLGRVVWICELSGSIHGVDQQPTSPPADEWLARRHRAILLLAEKERDAARTFARDKPGGIEEQRANAERDRLDAIAAASAPSLGEPARAPRYSTFADKVVEASTLMFGATGHVPPRAPYDRLSQSSHGTLFGLLGDTSGDDASEFRFEQDDADLAAIAENVGAWWYTAGLLLGRYHGWLVREPLETFWRALPTATE